MLSVRTKSKKTPMISAIVAALLASMIIIFAACSRDSGDGDAADLHIDSAAETESLAGVVIPDLRGYMREELEQQFENLGFTPSFLRLTHDSPAGTILFIERIGQHVPAPATIQVHVSAGLLEPVADSNLEQIATQIPQDESDSTEPTSQALENVEFGGINWRVLDVRENRALILSEHVLFSQPYNDEWLPVTWESSALRDYLNNEFLSRFSPEEMARIAEALIYNHDNPQWGTPGGNDTYDGIFLLSIEETRRYFEQNSARVGRNEDGQTSSWWLRSPGISNFTAYIVGHDGTLGGLNVSLGGPGVRPALWLYLE